MPQRRSEDAEAGETGGVPPGAAALAQRIVRVLESDLGYENGAVLLTDAATRRLVPIALADRGEGEAFLKKDMAFVASRAPRVGTGITGWVAQTGQSVVTGDVSQDSRYYGLRDAIRSEVAVPVQSSRGVIGVLNAETPRAERYTERDARVLSLFAGQIALAIENSWLEEELGRLRRLEGMSLRAGGAAHDMNNLLAAIAGRCEMLLHQAPDDSLSSDLRSVRDTALRAASLTRDLLAFRRSDDPKPKRTDLNRLVEGMRGTIQDLAGSGVLLLTVLAPDLGTIYVDPSMFERVITNLALNAAQAMPRGGTLTIETSNVEALPDQRGAGVALTIRDTGVGMNEETRARLFEPFFTTRPTGTGLGLPTVRRIVEQHGGQIAFDSEPGRGTTFRVCLPRA